LIGLSVGWLFLTGKLLSSCGVPPKPELRTLNSLSSLFSNPKFLSFLLTLAT
jgi:hypothetical protein